MARKRPARKVRVDFRQNRQVRRRSADWTHRYRTEEDAVVDATRSESVRAKGELSRKRTVMLGADDLPVVDEALWLAGTVCKVHGRVAYVRDDAGKSWECTVRRVLRTLLIATRSPVTVGDRVWISDQSQAADGAAVGVIERVAPRATKLSRRDRRQREHTIVANADQLVIVASVAEPKLRPHLVDRYLVAAHKGELRPVICFNKMDLMAADALADTGEEAEAWESGGPGGRAAPVADLTGDAHVLSVIGEFRALGYACIETSIVTGQGLDGLRAALQGHISVLSGQSGVGKSSLINALQPGLDLKIASVSAETEKGRHTTSLAELLPLDFGGYVVDTPGIRAFDLWSVNPGELEALFIDIAPYVPQCRFKNCLHRDEEGCAVTAAVEAGRISPRRYLSYVKMLEEV